MNTGNIKNLIIKETQKLLFFTIMQTNVVVLTLTENITRVNSYKKESNSFIQFVFFPASPEW